MSEAVDLTPIERALQAWIMAASGLTDGRVIWSGYGKRRPQLNAPPDDQWISLLMSDTSDDGWPWVDELDNPLVFTPLTFTASASVAPGVLTAVAHGLVTGDGPVRLTTAGVLPAGLALATDYWVIVVSANTFRLAANFLDAMATVPVSVAITTVGTGAHTLSVTSETVRAGAEQTTVINSYVSATLSIQCYGGLPTGNRSPMNVLRTVVTSAHLPSVRDAFTAADIYVDPSGHINDVGALINSSRQEPRAHVDVKIAFVASVTETGTVIERVGVVFDVADPTGSVTETAFDVTADDV